MFLRKLPVLLLISLVSGKECPTHSDDRTGPPFFSTDTSGGQITARIGHFAELECCVQGTNDIVWAKLNVPTGTWETLNSTNLDEDRTEFINNRQTLLFKSVLVQDEGSYMCSVSMNGTNYSDLSRKFSIEVVACDPLARGPYAIAPIPCETTVCDVGEDISLPCNAYFGCSDGDDLRLVEWFVSRDETEGSHWMPATEFDNRYKVTTSQSGNGAEIRTNLTILSVKPEDTRLKFKCMLASAQILHGQTDIVVKLTTKDNYQQLDTDMASLTLPAIVTGVSVMALLLVVFVIVTVVQARKTRKHLSKDIERKISNDMRPLHFKDSSYNDNII